MSILRQSLPFKYTHYFNLSINGNLQGSRHISYLGVLSRDESTASDMLDGPGETPDLARTQPRNFKSCWRIGTSRLLSVAMFGELRL